MNITQITVGAALGAGLGAALGGEARKQAIGLGAVLGAVIAGSIDGGDGVVQAGMDGKRRRRRRRRRQQRRLRRRMKRGRQDQSRGEARPQIVAETNAWGDEALSADVQHVRETEEAAATSARNKTIAAVAGVGAVVAALTL